MTQIAKVASASCLSSSPTWRLHAEAMGTEAPWLRPEASSFGSRELSTPFLLGEGASGPFMGEKSELVQSIRKRVGPADRFVLALSLPPSFNQERVCTVT